MALSDAQRYLIRAYFEIDVFDSLRACENPRFAFNQLLLPDAQTERTQQINLGIDEEITLGRQFLYVQQNPQILLNLDSRGEPGQASVTAGETKEYIEHLIREQIAGLPTIVPPAEAEAIPAFEPPDFVPEITPEQMGNFILFLTRVFLNRPIDLTEDSTNWILFALGHDQPQEFREAALKAIRYCPSEKITRPLRCGIMRALRYDPDDRVRSAAAEALAHLVRLSSSDMNELVTALYHQFRHDAYQTVRISAAETLYRHGDRNPELLQYILRALRYPGYGIPHTDGADLVRARAATTLGLLGALSSEIRRSLENAARYDSFAHVKIAANATLARLGLSRDNALQALSTLALGRFDAESARRQVADLHAEGFQAPQFQELSGLRNEVARLREQLQRRQQQGANARLFDAPPPARAAPQDPVRRDRCNVM